MWLRTRVPLNRSNITVPAAIAANVATERTGPAHTFVALSLPCDDIERAPKSTARIRKPIPYSAICRACVDEKSETAPPNWPPKSAGDQADRGRGDVGFA